VNNSGDVIGTVNNDSSLLTYLTITGGQMPYTVAQTPSSLLPCGIKLRTTYELSSPLNCTEFTSSTALLAGRQDVTLGMHDIFVQDGNDVLLFAPDMNIRRGPDDCADPANGPGGKGCEQNAFCVDAIKFDGS
jgi:hypothetical protein